MGGLEVPHRPDVSTLSERGPIEGCTTMTRSDRLRIPVLIAVLAVVASLVTGVSGAGAAVSPGAASASAFARPDGGMKPNRSR